jgi:hypothetical protein
MIEVLSQKTVLPNFQDFSCTYADGVRYFDVYIFVAQFLHEKCMLDTLKYIFFSCNVKLDINSLHTINMNRFALE